MDKSVKINIHTTMDAGGAKVTGESLFVGKDRCHVRCEAVAEENKRIKALKKYK
jgi:hypothetical protein